MKSSRSIRHLIFAVATILAVLPCASISGHAQILYVANKNGTTVGEYDANTGATINASFIAGLFGPVSLALAGNTLYVANDRSGTVGQYNATTGAAINANFISISSTPVSMVLGNNILYVGTTSLSVNTYNATTGAPIRTPLASAQGAYGMALAGNILYVTNLSNNTVGTYNATTGAVLNANFITGLNTPASLLISGNTLFVGNIGNNNPRIGTYDATTGAVINASFSQISPLAGNPGGANGLALLDNALYASSSSNIVTKYDATTGAITNFALVNGLNNPVGLLVSGVPEPATLALLMLGGLLMFTVIGVRRVAQPANRQPHAPNK